MDTERTEVVKDKTFRENEVSKISKVFNVLFIINLVIIGLFTLYLFMNSKSILSGFTNNMLYRIPYVGDILHLLLKSFNIIDVKQVHSTIYPVFILEILYYTLPLLLFQFVLFGLKKRIVKRDNAYFSFVLMFIVVIGLTLVKPMQSLIIFSTQSSVMQLRSLLVLFIMFLQLFCVISICYNLSKIQRFNFSSILTHGFGHSVMKVGAIASLSILIIFGSSLLFANSKVEDIQQKVSVEYVFDLKEAADGTVNIVVPKALIASAKMVGVNIPDTISGGQVVERFFQTEIDFGAMVTNTINSTITSLANKYIMHPFTNATSAIILIAIAIGLHYAALKLHILPIAVYGVQFILIMLLNIIYGSAFGILVAIGFGLLLVGSAIHLLSEIVHTSYWKQFTNQKKDIIKD